MAYLQDAQQATISILVHVGETINKTKSNYGKDGSADYLPDLNIGGRLDHHRVSLSPFVGVCKEAALPQQ